MYNHNLTNTYFALNQMKIIYNEELMFRLIESELTTLGYIGDM